MSRSLAINYKPSNDGSSMIFYLIILTLHTLFYCLAANLQDVKLSFLMLVFNSFIFAFLIIFYFNEPIYLLYHLVFSIVFQNVLVGLGNNFTDYQTHGENIKLLFIYKEMYIGIIFSFLFIRFKTAFRFISFEKVIIPFIIWVAISFVISDANLESKFFYIRQYLIVFLCYFSGRLIFFGFKNDVKKIYSVIKFTIWLGVLSVAFGVLFYFIDRDSYIWQDWFNLNYVLQAKGLEGGTPNWDTPIGQFMVPRMFSIFFDVITLSYFLMVALICSLLLKRNIPVIFIRIFLFSGLVLTLGKGALGIYLIAQTWVFFLFYVKIRPRTFITPLISFLTIFFLIAYNSNFKSSAIVHFEGFVQPLLNSYLHPIGNGIGSGGIYYAMLAGIPAWNLSYMGTESFLGSLLYQLGYPGFLLYIIFFIGCIRYILKKAYENKINYHLIMLSGIMFSLFLVSFFQEATLGLNYSGILTILVGFTISSLNYHKKETP